VQSQSRVIAGRYRLVAPLGSGGMGTVWRAEDELLGRAVAVKEVTFPAGLRDEDRDVLRERTRREARAAARLDHPSAVTVYDVVEEHGAPYLVMELVEARTLSQVVRTDGPLSPQRTARVGLALLGALEAAHRQGIVHRDVKPGNVLLGAEDRVVLTDFGIASSPGDSSITSTGLLLGSPSYIAPERARGQSPRPASDLWSLGATLFTAVEGKPPYDAGEPLLTVTQVVTGEHAPYVHAGPLEPVLEGLLERDPDRRLTAGHARAELERVAATPAPATMTAPTTPLPLPKPPAERTAALPADQVRAAAAAPAPRRNPTWERPQRPPRSRRSPVPALLSALALLLAVGVVALVLVTDPGRGSIGAFSEGGSATPSATAESTVESTPAPVPDGWTRYEDPQGWSVAVPPGYVQSTHRGLVQFKDPETRRTLRVDQSDDPKPSALQAWQQFSPQLGASLADYQELRLEEVDYKGLDAADLEFTYFDQTQLRVLDRTFVTEDGDEAYALYWQVPASGFEESLPVFEQIAASFTPAR
jgi:serine/threonine protein kinase